MRLEPRQTRHPDAPAHFGAPILAPLLAVDTCGPSGSVALGRLAGRDLEILGQTELAGRTYSATLVSAVASLLESAGVKLGDLGGIVAVHGPGSFTGVRVGLSTVKGLAQAAEIPVVPLSRLLVLARKAGAPSAAIDAQRGEIFLRLEGTGREPVEILAGPEELRSIASAGTPPVRLAVCDEAAAALIASAWPSAQLIRTAPPLASDALRLGESRLAAGAAYGLALGDLALLDGHYLRRSDAEIFAEPQRAGSRKR
jgi:tRNA threonylcarbamoyladenosine biosynthesis protein TsaB